MSVVVAGVDGAAGEGAAAAVNAANDAPAAMRATVVDSVYCWPQWPPLLLQLEQRELPIRPNHLSPMQSQAVMMGVRRPETLQRRANCL